MVFFFNPVSFVFSVYVVVLVVVVCCRINLYFSCHDVCYFNKMTSGQVMLFSIQALEEETNKSMCGVR